MVNTELYEAYATSLDKVDELAQQAVERIIQGAAEYMTQGGLNWRNVKAWINSQYTELVNLYGDAAMQVVNEFYMGQRAIAGIDDDFYTMLAERVSELATRSYITDEVNFEPIIANKTWRDAKDLLSDSAIQQLARDLKADASWKVRSAADRQFERNLSRDKAYPKWALIASPTACGWCKMHASRDFIYHSEKKVQNIRHKNCKCKVVVDFDTENPALAGYNSTVFLNEYEYARGPKGSPIYATDRATIGARLDAMQHRDHNDPTYYWRVTKPKNEAIKRAKEAAKQA